MRKILNIESWTGNPGRNLKKHSSSLQYKNDIRSQPVIDKMHLRFSRDTHQSASETEWDSQQLQFDIDAHRQGYFSSEEEQHDGILMDVHPSDEQPTIDVCLIKKYHSRFGSGTNSGLKSSSSTSAHLGLEHGSNNDAHLSPSSNSNNTHSRSRAFLDYNDDLKSSPLFCNESSDGISCWPETPAGGVAAIPCSFQLHGVRYETGIATRFCETNGTWVVKSNYGHCKELTAEESLQLSLNLKMYLSGYAFSLCFLLIAVIIFVSFKELYCLRNKIHTQLILTYIFADTLWIITSFMGSQASTHASCITFILLHFFHITKFFWMFVEGLYLYILVVQTFIADNIKMRTYVLIGWGIPILILGIWSFARWMAPHEMDESLSIKDPEFEALPTCAWLNNSVYDWIFKAPVFVVLAANILFLIQIMWVLITKLRSAMNPETQQSRKAAKALLVLMPLLGITYILLLTGSKEPIYEYIRALLISTQGFLVALLYCFCNGEVRTTLRHRWNRVLDWSRNRSCCGCEFEGLQAVQQMRDSSSPLRSRTESIRLYTPNLQNFRKRESSGVSDITTTSTIRAGSLNGSPNIKQTMTVLNKNNARISTTTIPIHDDLMPVIKVNSSNNSIHRSTIV